MKKLLLMLCICILMGCSKEGAVGNCGSHDGRSLIKGPEGGCYYNNSNGNKTYVDRSMCKC